MLECGGIPSARALHEARFLSEFFPHGIGFPAVESRAAARGSAGSGSRSVLHRRRHDHRNRRRLFRRASRGRPHPHRRAHRGAGARHRARRHGRCNRAHASFDRLHARRQDHDAAGQRRRDVHARRRRLEAGVVAVHHRESRDAGDRRERNARRARVRENQPASQPRSTNSSPRKRSPNGSGEYPHKEDIAVLWPLAQALFEKRQEARATATACGAKSSATTTSISTWKASTSRSRRAAAARRST